MVPAVIAARSTLLQDEGMELFAFEEGLEAGLGFWFELLTNSPENAAAAQRAIDLHVGWSGLTDDLGAETMMMEALEKVEKEIMKPLLRSDKKNIGLLLSEFEKINKKSGLTDDLGAETMMMEALEKVEKEIMKPLLRSDKKNIGLLLSEFEKINKKFC